MPVKEFIFSKFKFKFTKNELFLRFFLGIFLKYYLSLSNILQFRNSYVHFRTPPAATFEISKSNTGKNPTQGKTYFFLQ